MVGCRCYLLDAEDHIVQAHNLDCDGDVQAQMEAENFLTLDPYYSYVEVWRAPAGSRSWNAGPAFALVCCVRHCERFGQPLSCPDRPARRTPPRDNRGKRSPSHMDARTPPPR